MVSSLPTEIWTQILTAAIHVPIFFEADPLKICLPDFYHQYHWQSDYWASERTRNTLRRVCAFWNSILAPYDNRFIQFRMYAQAGSQSLPCQRLIESTSAPPINNVIADDVHSNPLPLYQPLRSSKLSNKLAHF
ncbi:hypothetical protein PIIN_11130 [Serendipita indica DSM 11827]|uniref:Uncharacterized protein n=1 Tax=Serendipita indica (strain DSM 11827) TaxID=1109443 RepID=G4U0Q4_SERID|nr:hypothetical protein PIIN_11130 [Serendipita indica DSM 11827]